MQQSLYFRTLLCFLALGVVNISFGQGRKKIELSSINYGDETYILLGTPKLKKCDINGDTIKVDPFFKIRAQRNSLFKIEDVRDSNNYIISFLNWENTNNENRLKFIQYNSLITASLFNTYNQLSEDTAKKRFVKNLNDSAYFLISKVDLLQYGTIYEPSTRLQPAFGTISYLTRIRPQTSGESSRWSTDLNLGIAAGVSYPFKKNLSLTALFGIGITKVTLDSISTKGFVKSTSERPSLVPSISILGSYKRFSIGIGLGWDFVNRDSPETKAWIYNRKNFYCLAFGINIFTASDTDTPKAKDQKPTP